MWEKRTRPPTDVWRHEDVDTRTDEAFIAEWARTQPDEGQDSA